MDKHSNLQRNKEDEEAGRQRGPSDPSGRDDERQQEGRNAGGGVATQDTLLEAMGSAFPSQSQPFQESSSLSYIHTSHEYFHSSVNTSQEMQRQRQPNPYVQPDRSEPKAKDYTDDQDDEKADSQGEPSAERENRHMEQAATDTEAERAQGSWPGSTNFQELPTPQLFGRHGRTSAGNSTEQRSKRSDSGGPGSAQRQPLSALSAREQEQSHDTSHPEHARNARSMHVSSKSKVGGTEANARGKVNIGSSLISSTEQSPNLRQPTSTGPQAQASRSNNSYKSPRSQLQSSEANSSSKPPSNPADNYQFLGGIREVDDDQESMSAPTTSNLAGTIVSSNAKSLQGGRQGSSETRPYFARAGRSLQDSMESCPGDAGAGSGPAGEAASAALYGTVQAYRTNPFLASSGNKMQWSSGKDQLSDRQPSFGAGIEQDPSHGGVSEASPPRQQEHYYDAYNTRLSATQAERVLTKVWHKSLATMGEKACMRLSLKEIAATLDTLNELMCKQTVQQELILSDETPAYQLNQIMDMSLHQQTAEEMIQDKQAASKRKSNMQLMETIRTESQMMALRFQDFQDREDNIYRRFVKERERNQVLQEELQKREGAGAAAGDEGGRYHESARQLGSLYHQTVASDWIDTEKQSNLAHLVQNSQQQYAKDTLEPHDGQHQRFNSTGTQPAQAPLGQGPASVEQLSPGSPFNVRQSPIAYTPSPTKNEPEINDSQQDLLQPSKLGTLREDSHRQSISRLQEVRQALDTKDKQIESLNQYVEAIKKEFALYRQSCSNRFSLQASNIESPGSRKLAGSLEEHAAHERMAEMQFTIQNLQRRNQSLEAQLKSNLSPGVMRVEDGLDNLTATGKMELDVWQHLRNINQDSSSSKRYSPSGKSPSPDRLLNRTTQQAAAERIPKEALDARRSTHQPVSMTSKAYESSRIHVGGASLAEPSSQTYAAVALGPSYAQVPDMNSSQVTELLEKLDKQARIAKRLDENEVKLLEQIRIKDQQFSDLQKLTRELQSQSRVNSEALEKAGLVIQRLDEELRTSEEANAKLAKDVAQLKRDNAKNRTEMQELERNHQEREQGMEARLQRTQSEHQIEVKELCERLEQVQQEADEERGQLQAAIRDLREEVEKGKAINTSLEAKQQADQAKANNIIKTKSNEILEYHNRNLSLQVQMGALEDQTRQDLEISQDLHHREVLYLKNRINQLEQEIRTKTQNAHFYADQMTKARHVDQDDTEIPKVNGAYLHQLSHEFTTLSNELQKLRELTTASSQANLQSQLRQHIEKFGDFQRSVLDSLSLWHQKSTGLAVLAQRYLDTLEEYKMMFVQMKQLLKEKDGIVRRTRSQLDALKEVTWLQQEALKSEHQQATGIAMEELHALSDTMRQKVLEKSTECTDLLQYQEEFREEYIRVCAHRDELQRSMETYALANEGLHREFDALARSTKDLKESLRKTLEIQEGPHSHEILQQHAQMVMDTNKSNKIQIAHLQEKNNELILEVENQRALFKKTLGDNQQQLEQSQAKYLKNLDEANQGFNIKEQEYEQQLTELQKEVTRHNQEAALRDRQMKKYEGKLESEVKKHSDLQLQMEFLVGEKNRVIEAKDAIEKSYGVLEGKLKTTQDCLDARVKIIEELEEQHKDARGRFAMLEAEIRSLTAVLRQNEEALRSAEDQIERQKAELSSLNDQLSFVKDENKQLLQESQKLKRSEQYLVEVGERTRVRVEQLEGELKAAEAELADLQVEAKRYESTVSFMSRQLDQEKLKLLDAAILKAENGKLKDTITLKEQEIERLHDQYVNPPRSSVGCQTDNDLVDENDYLRRQVYTLRKAAEEHDDEVGQLHEAMGRQNNDVERLIDDKRQLENELQESQERERNYRQILMQNENYNATNRGHAQLRGRSGSPSATHLGGESDPRNGLEHRATGSFNARKVYGKAAAEGSSQLQLILNEKDNYIERLNTELNELRVENERVKDKLIVFELENLERQTAHGATSVQHKQPFRSTRGRDQTMYSSQERTFADTRSNGAYNDMGRVISAATNQRYESHFGHTQEFHNHLTWQDQSQGDHQDAASAERHGYDRPRYPGTGSRNIPIYQTLSANPAKTPYLGSQATATLDRDNIALYTLNETQPPNVRSNSKADSRHHDARAQANNSGMALRRKRDFSLSGEEASAFGHERSTGYSWAVAAPAQHSEQQNQAVSPQQNSRPAPLANVSSIREQDSRQEGAQEQNSQFFSQLSRV